MLPCRQDVAMILKQEERHRDKQSTIQRYEVHFTSIQRTSSVTYYAVRKTTQHKLPQSKLGPTIYAIRPPVGKSAKRKIPDCSIIAEDRLCNHPKEPYVLCREFLQVSINLNSACCVLKPGSAVETFPKTTQVEN